jgi:Flp pilus assembly protein TadG
VTLLSDHRMAIIERLPLKEAHQRGSSNTLTADQFDAHATTKLLASTSTANVAQARFFNDKGGVAAVEFALIAPLFLLILVGVADFGGALYTKFSLDGTVAAAANYAIQNSSSVSSTGGSGLAINLANIVASGHSANWANAMINVTNGPSATLTAGVITTGGTASNADTYYCPSKSGATITWGASTANGATCANGGLSGRFVQITASRAYAPIFGSYNIVQSKTVSAIAMVQTQ